MYTSHFGFNAKPFQISSDPKFLWFGEQHKEALAILEYGIQENKGVIALSGGVGTGKTTLINALMYRIKDDVIAAVVSDPGLETMDFFCYIANLYGLTNRVDTKVEFICHFSAFLKNASRQRKKVLLIIDEAQRLSADMLEEIRLLSNIEQLGKRLLNVFLVGQNELNAMLIKPANRGLKQRIATHFNIVPLTLDEVGAYIGYRLGVAGCQRRIFTSAAIKEIFVFSEGYPRLINTICDQSLISAYVSNSPEVTADMVTDSAKEFRFLQKASLNPPVSNGAIIAKTIETPAPPSVRSHYQKGKIRKPPRNENQKNVFPFFRLAYIGLALVLLFFSWYLLAQYKKDAKPQNATALSPPSAEKSATLSAAADTLPIVKNDSKRSSILARGVTMPIEFPREPHSAKPEGDMNSPSAIPPELRKKPSVTIPGSNGASVSPAAHASPPDLTNDKDPGAIIDWLIQKNKYK